MPRTDECFELHLTEDEYAYLRYLMSTREASNVSEAQRRHLWDKLNYANDLAHNPNMMQARAIVTQYRTIRRRYGSFYRNEGETIPPIEMVIRAGVLQDPHSREYLDEHIPEGNVRWHILDEGATINSDILSASYDNPIYTAVQIPRREQSLKQLYQKYIADDTEGFHLTFEIKKAPEKKLGFFKE